MKDPTRPDDLQTALDEAEAVIEELERVDAALGAYLVRCLAEPAGRAEPSAPVGRAGWYRARIHEWCCAPRVRAQFNLEAVESTRLAVPELTDEELRLLVRDLVERGAGRAEATPGAMAVFRLARPTRLSAGATGQTRLRGRQR
jgi:hypothetical protein